MGRSSMRRRTPDGGGKRGEGREKGRRPSAQDNPWALRGVPRQWAQREVEIPPHNRPTGAEAEFRLDSNETLKTSGWPR